MYITGENDQLCLLANTKEHSTLSNIVDTLCQFNPHLQKHRSLMLYQGRMPPHTPILDPGTTDRVHLREQQNDVRKVFHAPEEERKKMSVVSSNPEGVLAANKTLTMYNKTVFEEFSEKYLQPQEFAVTYAILDELANSGRDAIETSEAFNSSRQFIKILKDQDKLIAEHSSLLKNYKDGNHPIVRAAWRKVQESNRAIRKMHYDQISQLPKPVKRQVKSTTLLKKNARNGCTVNQHGIPKLVGSRHLSYETMQKLIKGTRYVNKSVLGLGVMAAGIETYQAYRDGADWVKPGFKWGGSFAGSMGAGYLTTQAAMYAIPLAVSALSGLAMESVVIFLTCTPWGWVSLGVIVGVGSFFGGKYGEKLVSAVYDKAQPYVQYGWEKTSAAYYTAKDYVEYGWEKTNELYDQGQKIITESWDDICKYAKDLYEGWFSFASPEPSKG
ncbi:MAG: hypothetical protein AB7O96_01140 [Pseudobdellovibrionaceae bacterium]|nr:hypothetical protein [Halobacteriovoraceae bacterium]